MSAPRFAFRGAPVHDVLAAMIAEIDGALGADYARTHPEIVGAIMVALAVDGLAAVIQDLN